MFNQDVLKSVANQSNTSKSIFDAFASRKRFRSQTNLNKLRIDLLNKGERIDNDEYLETFKSLQDMGIGSLIIGRRGKPNRFKWNYSLKDVAKIASNAESIQDIAEIKRPRGRPPGSVNKRPRGRTVTSVKAKSQGALINLTVNLPPSVTNKDIQALLELIKGMGQ